MPRAEQALEQLLREAGEAHHRAFAHVDGKDPTWPDWYARYLAPKLARLLTFTETEFATALREVEAERQAGAPGSDWPPYYATRLLARFGDVIDAAVGPPRLFAREQARFVASVLVGSVVGLLVGQLLLRWVSSATAGNAALALATTVTGATHARLAHRRSARSLVPSVAAGAPLAYVVMRAIHALLGS